MWGKLLWMERGIVVDDGDGYQGDMGGEKKKGVKWRDDRKYGRKRIWVLKNNRKRVRVLKYDREWILYTWIWWGRGRVRGDIRNLSALASLSVSVSRWGLYPWRIWGHCI